MADQPHIRGLTKGIGGRASAPQIAPSGHAVRRREIRVELDSLVEQFQRLVTGLPGPPVKVRYSAQVVVVGIGALGPLVFRAFDLGRLQVEGVQAGFVEVCGNGNVYEKNLVNGQEVPILSKQPCSAK